MPQVSELPVTLSPYTFHGVNLVVKGKEALAEYCPFCGKERKFSVNVDTGQWRCFSCNEGQEKNSKIIKGGNALVFLQKLWHQSYQDTPSEAYEELAEERGYLYWDTLMAWQLARSSLRGEEWLIPGYEWKKGNLCQLYRYVTLRSGEKRGKRVLLATPGGPEKHTGIDRGVGLFGRNKELWGSEKDNGKSRTEVYLCEGIWDAIALWETLRMVRYNDERELVQTANPQASLLGNANVLGCPGNFSFQREWLPLFSGKVVNLLGDSDYPNERNGNKCAGLEGVKRVVKILYSRPQFQPTQVRYLDWGELGYDPNRSDGFDIRDMICQ